MPLQVIVGEKNVINARSKSRTAGAATEIIDIGR